MVSESRVSVPVQACAVCGGPVLWVPVAGSLMLVDVVDGDGAACVGGVHLCWRPSVASTV